MGFNAENGFKDTAEGNSQSTSRWSQISSPCTNRQDIDDFESLETAHGTLFKFTGMLSAENFVTVSVILPVIHHILKNEVLSIANDDTQLTEDIKTWILCYLEQKYNDFDICELLNLATFLDPRFVTEYTPTSVEVAATKDRLAKEGTEIWSSALSILWTEE